MLYTLKVLDIFAPIIFVIINKTGCIKDYGQS